MPSRLWAVVLFLSGALAWPGFLDWVVGISLTLRFAPVSRLRAGP